MAACRAQAHAAAARCRHALAAAPPDGPCTPPPLLLSRAVTDLAGRIFATWTLTSCVLCLICARNPCVPAIYGARSRSRRPHRAAAAAGAAPAAAPAPLLLPPPGCDPCCLAALTAPLLPAAARRRHAGLLPHRAAALCHGAAPVPDAGPRHRAAAHDRRGCAPPALLAAGPPARRHCEPPTLPMSSLAGCCSSLPPPLTPPPPARLVPHTAGVSSLWMGLGWNYYTAYAPRAEPTMSEDITVTQKDD